MSTIFSPIKKKLVLFLALLFILIAFNISFADMYIWKDDKGVVHATNDPRQVPPQYKDNLKVIEEPSAQKPEKKKNVQPPEQKQDTTDIVSPTKTENNNKDVESPEEKHPNPFILISESAGPPFKQIFKLRKRKGSYMVRVVLNESVETDLILDTGSYNTILSTRVAKELGFSVTPDTPVTYVHTAGNIVENYLFVLDSIRIGKFTIKNPIVYVNDHFPDKSINGLIGLNFLKSFDVRWNMSAETLTLQEFDSSIHGKLYGGYPLIWWKERYSYFQNRIRALKKLRREFMEQGKKDKVRHISAAISLYQDYRDRLRQEGEILELPPDWRRYRIIY